MAPSTPSTPARKRKQCPLDLSPCVPLKKQAKQPRRGSLASAQVAEKPKSPHVIKLEKAAAALRPGASMRGGLLPCRSVERKRIATHLRTGVEQGGSTQVLYVSGMPGTGKTAIVLEVLEHMRKVCKYDLVHVNAMRLGHPSQVFRDIADQMNLQTTSADASSNLTDHFRTRKAEDPVIVLLIDEVDCLVTPTQAVLYRVFDWLTTQNARLVLAAISNTMDLPERLLPRVASRFHIERVDFCPYNKNQLYEILCARLKHHHASDVFGDIVLRLCAARVAAASGDIRKALQVSRRAAELRLQAVEQEGHITIADLESAEKEITLANPVAQGILSMSAQTRRFLTAVVLELRRKDSDVVVLSKAQGRWQKLVAITELHSERGSTEEQAAASTSKVPGSMASSAVFMARRLERMDILRKPSAMSSATELSPNVPLSLGSLDIEDLSCTLLRVEEDPTIRELLEGVRPGEEPSRTFKPAD